MKSIDKLLFRMIAETKGQFIAVAAVLAVGLIFYTAMGVSAINLERGMHRYYDEYSFADLSCEVDVIGARQLRALEGLDGVAAAEGRVTEDLPFLTGEDGDGRAKVKAITAKPGNAGVNRLLLEEGGLLEEGSREVLVIRQFAEARGIRPDDEITLQIAGRAVDFSVAGIVSSPEFVYLVDPEQGILPDNQNYGVVYMDEWMGQQILGYPGSYNDVQMTEEPGLDKAARDDLAEEIGKRLGSYGSRGVVKRENQISNAMMASEIDQLNVTASALPGLFLFIAALILAMMLGRMVKRDVLSIGIMKGLGYSSAQIVLHYVKYSLLVALAGGVAGAGVGMVLANLLTTYYMTFYNLPNLNQAVDWKYMLASLLMACAFCVAAGLLGARGVRRVSPAESMVAESPRPGKRILLERLRFVWSRLSFSDKMAMKNVFRNKKRTAFVLVGVFVTYGMLVFVLCMPSMMSDMMGEGLEEFQPMDYNVSFKRPVSEKALGDVPRLLDAVDEMEGKAEYPVLLSSGPREISLSVIGLERDTVFYNFKNQAGDAIDIPENGVLLSDYAAKELRVGAGDRVRLHAYLTGSEDRWIEVGGVVYQAMGVNAYMRRDVLAREYLAPGAVTGFFLNTDDPNTESKLLALPAVASVSSLAATRESFQEYTQIMNAFIFFMVILSGILGFAIVYNATIISIGEREREFSSLRVLGFSGGDIFRLLLKENNLISVAGFVAGVPLANLFLRYSSDIFSTEQYTMHLRAGPSHYLGGMAMAVFFIVLAQAATYRKIQKLDFMAALKNRA
ncbi:MAG: FtsX-like permease family protein [Clostridiales Family XIII bacterium]|jgi:putative ABC transport system permease protein|nr:FtsX-like permease family protein [Clostridiales Family XIII bacterium]